jgi:hypothetical protein
MAKEGEKPLCRILKQEGQRDRHVPLCRHGAKERVGIAGWRRGRAQEGQSVRHSPAAMLSSGRPKVARLFCTLDPDKGPASQPKLPSETNQGWPE